jgi:broad-specificity NMP kinase
MSNNILDLSNIESKDLIKELENRGYKTDLVYNIEDVNMQLEYINADRSKKKQIELDDDTKEMVLQEAIDEIFDYVCEKINYEIQDKIMEYV